MPRESWSTWHQFVLALQTYFANFKSAAEYWQELESINFFPYELLYTGSLLNLESNLET